ncbi:N-acetylated-alpha-linked acidic dipeptidase 2-like [Ptychodera flava]|uniref:N-acetylated-alpha-linked acidic dipeptidase 2-like n=1 Tax=Ptychodera flava TaxID=63121 RepID=UPI003969D977
MRGEGNRQLLLLVGVASLFVGFVIGILIGALAIDNSEPENAAVTAALRDGDPSISDKLINEIDKENIKEFLRYFTSDPHLAGTPMDLVQAEYVRDKWLEQGLDYADVVPYDVLLSYPRGKENRVELIDNTGDVEFESAREEAILDESQRRDDIVPPFIAYSAAGVVEGDLVFANFASLEDFDHLEKDIGINLTDKIIIAKNGGLFRGDKAFLATKKGAKGLILYSDPALVAPKGYENQTYPNGIFLPGTGVERGSLNGHMMDPLTPGYPARDYAYRIDESEASLPTIPVHPIGYDDARQFLRRLGGDEVKEEWKGHLNITYRYGPGFRGEDAGKKIRLVITTENKMATTYNVIGSIRGAIEPDKYVIVGNHRDAFVFGALDPSSAMAAMMEMSRAYGKLVRDGWRPRRSIVFCSWGAEEYGMIGSNEFVEEFSKSLTSRAVVYLNLDIAVVGNHTIIALSSPLLFKAMHEATKKVKDPNRSSNGKVQTVYENWLQKGYKTSEDLPIIGDLGSGTDHAPFIHRIGVPSTFMMYFHQGRGNVYPMYHSVYDTFHLLSTYYDPTFEYHATVGRVQGELLRSFADSLVLPMDCRDYAKRIYGLFQSFKTDYGEKLGAKNISLDILENAIQNMTSSAEYFHTTIDGLKDTRDPMAYRIANDVLAGFERVFIDPLGLPDRSMVRHVIFAPDSQNAHASSGFPGLKDALFQIELVDQEDEKARWNQVRHEVARLTHVIESAAAYLDDFLMTLHRGKHGAQ